MRHAIRLIPALLATFLIAACGTLGLQAPRTFEDHIANVLTGLSAARDTSTTLAQHGKIEAEDFAAFKDQCDSLREAIEVARTIHDTDADAGEQQLDKIIARLNMLNAYLERRKAGEAAPVPTTTTEVLDDEPENRRRVAGLHDHFEPADQDQHIERHAAPGGDRGAQSQ